MSVASQYLRIYKNARTHLPGALDSMIQVEMYSALDELLQGSGCWKEDIDFATVADTTIYEIEPEENVALIVRLNRLENADEIEVKSTMYEPGVIVLNTAPTVVETLTAKVVLTVSTTLASGDPNVPEWILAKYSTGLVDGLVGRMMAQPAKPYTSERLSIYRMRRFVGAIARARVEAQHGNLTGGQTWQFPQSFATGRR